MKKKYLVVVFIFLIGSILAENIKKTIEIGKNEVILDIHTLNKFTAISTYKRAENIIVGYNLYVYDNNGNEIIKKTDLDITPNQVFISPYQSVVVIMNGGEFINDVIRSYNITTGNKNWTTTANAYSYTLSPDSRKLLTQAKPMFKEGKIQIIDLEDGDKENVDIDLNLYEAEWLDNQRIVFLKYIFTESKENLRDEQDETIYKINLKIMDLNNLRRKEVITQKEYLKRVNILLKEKEENIRMKGRGRTRHKKRKIERTYELLTYNMKTKIIENKKSLENKGGEIKIPSYASDINIISVDLKQNIYICGYSNHKGALLKFNERFEQIGLYTFHEYSNINSFRDNGKLLFRLTTKEQEVKILDEEIGKFRQINEGDDYAEEIKCIHKKMNYCELNSGLKITKDSKVIKFGDSEVKK